MRFQTQRLTQPLSAAKRAELDALAAEVEAEIPDVAAAGPSAPFHQVLVLRTIMSALKQARVQAGLSLDEVSARSGVDKAHLSRLETSKVENVTFVTVERVAKALKKRVEFALVDDA